MLRSSIGTIVGALTLLMAVPASAQDEDPAEPAVAFNLRYKADVLGVVHGGLRKGVRYLDNLDATMAVDLERVAKLSNTRAFVYLLYNNGTSFSPALAGDAQIVSNIETGVQAVRLYEAWIEHGDERLAARVGLYDVSSEFDMLESSAMFVNSAFGTGTDLSQTGNNGPSIFPVTAPGVRLQGMIGEHLTLRGAVLEGTPGDPRHPGRTVIALQPRDGIFAIAEADVHAGTARLIAGTWRYTAKFEIQRGPDDGETGREPAMGTGNAGVYIRGEAQVAGNEERSLAAFFRLGTAAGRFNLFDHFGSVGVNARGLFEREGQGELGFGIAHARTSALTRSVTPDTALGETAFELSYRTKLTPHLAVQPDVQYIIDPSGSTRQRDVLVVGIRFDAILRP
ncbi:carbohydrate porin [Sphingomonas adhaesiva]|uniref:carbohydrate porin n=1 Tax=Sphingomonas adhaesiva TaxID=28212 RepID=UPI002FFCD235